MVRLIPIAPIIAALIALLICAIDYRVEASDYYSVPLTEAEIASTTTFNPPNERWIAQAEYNKVIPAVAASGELLWTAQDNYGWPTWMTSWRDINALSLDTGSSYALSLGNAIAPYINVREARAGETAHIRNRVESTAVGNAKCGAGFATACAYIFDALPANAYYKGALMSTYVFTGQAAVIQHEDYHLFAMACDQYVGGCPPTDDTTFQCTGNPETLMDCGLAARSPQYFDIITLFGAYVPDHAAGVNYELRNGWLALSWNCARKDGGAASAFKDSRSACRNATEVAFAFSKRGQAPTWVGELGCGSQFGYCYTPDEANYRWFDQYWVQNFDCGYIRLENAPFRFVPQASDVFAGEGWWQFVGCWR